MFRFLTLIALLFSSFPLPCCGCCARSQQAEEVSNSNSTQPCPYCTSSTDDDGDGKCPCRDNKLLRPTERQVAETLQLPIPNLQWATARNIDFHGTAAAGASCNLLTSRPIAESGRLPVLLCRLLC